MSEKSNRPAGKTGRQTRFAESPSKVAPNPANRGDVMPCPNCLEFFFRGHLEGQAHARAVDEDMADRVARHIRALELEHEANIRQLARAAIRAIDTQAARRAPGSSYVPMANPEGVRHD